MSDNSIIRSLSISFLLSCHRKNNNRDKGTPFHTYLYGHNPELKELSELITGNIFFLKLDNGSSIIFGTADPPQSEALFYS